MSWPLSLFSFLFWRATLCRGRCRHFPFLLWRATRRRGRCRFFRSSSGGPRFVVAVVAIFVPLLEGRALSWPLFMASSIRSSRDETRPSRTGIADLRPRRSVALQSPMPEITCAGIPTCAPVKTNILRENRRISGPNPARHASRKN